MAVIGILQRDREPVCPYPAHPEHRARSHPRTVAERLCRAVDFVGDRTRVIAGTDCGFGTLAGDSFTAEDVVWAKLASLREGADIASQRLWG
jgi:5-methyltetrahydropteroyltriglutamate--homocysteine methyltransferase